ncbi:hypothetical protein Aperf_G00000009696 [Anoplocephala perfoliata]
MTAPGARTFLHVIYVRFGRTAHILLCVFALINNLSIIASVIETGNKVFATISSDVDFDLVWIVSIIIAGICVTCIKFREVFIVSSIGSIFILASTLCFYVGVFFTSNNPNLGSIDKIYEANLAAKNLYDGYFNRLAFRNPFALILAMKKFFSNGFLFLDQSSWQSCSCADPGKESFGVIVSSILYLAIPYAFGTACSVGFVSLTPRDELNRMTKNEIETVPSVITANTLFGRNGLLLLFAVYAFIIANISVFQLFSISSILTYDIYAIHLRLNGSVLSITVNTIVATTLGPIVYTFFWDGMTSAGVVIGIVLSASITAFLSFGLSNLYVANNNLAYSKDILEGAIYFTAVALGFILPALVVCIERILKKDKPSYEVNTPNSAWARIYELDNPLCPWAIDYAASLPLTTFNVESYNRPSVEDVKRAYRFSWYFTLSSPVIFCFFCGGTITLLVSVSDVMELTIFKIWVFVVLILLIISTAVVTFMPIIYEGINLYRLRRTARIPQDQEYIIPRIEYSEAQDDTELRETPHSRAENTQK